MELRLPDRTVRLDQLVVVRGLEVLAELTPLEATFLRYLAERPGRIVDRDVLLRDVWGYADSVRSRAVDKTVNRLRTKLEIDAADPRHLVATRGLGYGLVLEPQAGALVGVDTLLPRLEAALKPGAVCVLVGPAGAGKTVIAQELTRRAPGRRWIDLTGAANAMDTIGDALDAAWGTGDRRAALSRALRAGPPTILLDGCTPEHDLGRLIAGNRGTTAWLVCTREEMPDVGGRTEHLLGLDVDSGVELLTEGARRAGATGDLARPALAELVRRVGGHPHTLVSLAPRLVLQPPERLLRAVDGWLAGEPHAWARVLSAATQEQWARLGEPTRRALAACAWLDAPFSTHEAVALLGDEDAALSALDEARAASVILPRPDGGLALVAPCVPLARAADPGASQLRAREIMVAEAERAARSFAAGEAGARARLVAARGRLIRIVEAKTPGLAARAALALWPITHRRDPVRFLEWTEDLPVEGCPDEVRGRLLVARADCQRLVGRVAEAEAALEAAFLLLPEHARAGRAHAAVVKAQLGYWKVASSQAVRELLEGALLLLSTTGERRLEVRIWNVLSQLNERERNLDAARAYALRAEEAARAIDDPELLGLALQFHAWVLRYEDRARARRLLQEAETVHTRAEDHLSALGAAINAAYISWNLGLVEEARKQAEDVERRAQALGDTLRVGMSWDLRGLLALEQGLFEIARAAWDRVRTLGEDSGNRVLVSLGHLGIAVIDHAEGRLGQAGTAYDAAIASGAHHDEQLMWARLLRRLLAAENGDRAHVVEDDRILAAAAALPQHAYHPLVADLVVAMERGQDLRPFLARLSALGWRHGGDPRVLLRLIRARGNEPGGAARGAAG